jgi:hypothetical protein
VPEAYCPHSSAVSGVKQVETVLSLYREYLKRFSISGDSAKKIKRDVISKLSRLLFYLLLRMNPDFLRVIKAVVRADIGVSINEFFFESLILGKGKVQNLFNRGREVKS